ncbi:MAG: hypothetical protein WKF58_19100 [Ilumatobacteraceae bacterium]
MAWLVTALIAASAGIGFAEHRQRLAVAKFTVGTVNDARLATLNRHLGAVVERRSRPTPGRRSHPHGRRHRTPARRVARQSGRARVLQHGTFIIGVFCDLHGARRTSRARLPGWCRRRDQQVAAGRHLEDGDRRS